MNTLFNLKQETSQLTSANAGISKMEYDERAPTRDVTTTNFPGGAIHIKWDVSGQKWWVPGRSYLRLRCRLSKATDAQLTELDGIAPNMGLAASLFQSAEFRINDKTISRVSDFMPQIDALETRLTKSRAWLGGVGETVNFWETDRAKRQTDTSSDGVIPSLTSNVKTSVGRLALGFGATTTVAWTLVGNVLTFATGTIPDVREIFPAGSVIQFPVAIGAEPAGTEFTVVNALTATTLSLAPCLIGANVAAAVLDFNKVSNGIAGRNVREFEIDWIPPLSIFKVGHAMPSGTYELILVPQTSSVYQKYAIESLVDKTPNLATLGAPSAGSNYTFHVTDMRMYVNTVEGPRADDITYLLDLKETACQGENIVNTAFQQKPFEVSPSTYALTAAYQDLRAGTNSIVSASKFKSYNAGLTNINSTSEELKLTRFFINYAGQNRPSPDADPNFTATIDRTTQRYIESLMYSGSFYNPGGAESLSEFHDRGSYYYFATPKDGTDRSTRVNVHQQFQTGTDMVNLRLLLFSHSRSVARIQVKGGKVVNVQLEEV